MPIYIVNPGSRLIRANTYSQAITYAAKASMTATPIKAEDLADALAKGVKIEDARKPETLPLPLPLPALANGHSPPADETPLPSGPLEPAIDTVEIDNVR